MGETVRFSQRFQGFTDGALGGYVAGVAARGIDGPAEANLRTLPLLDREMTLGPGPGGSTQMHADGTVVLEVHPEEFDLEIPAPPSPEGAEAANGNLVHKNGHLYPECFTCGPAREEGDGLRLFMGRLPGRDDLLAAKWTPDPRLVSDPTLPAEFVWAALDCPTIWAAWIDESGELSFPKDYFSVLARQRVEILGDVPTAQPVVVTAWPIQHDGRKHTTGAAIHSADGALLARGESLLIDVAR
jgi:hypothetical protein